MADAMFGQLEQIVFDDDYSSRAQAWALWVSLSLLSLLVQCFCPEISFQYTGIVHLMRYLACTLKPEEDSTRRRLCRRAAGLHRRFDLELKFAASASPLNADPTDPLLDCVTHAAGEQLWVRFLPFPVAELVRGELDRPLHLLLSIKQLVQKRKTAGAWKLVSVHH